MLGSMPLAAPDLQRLHIATKSKLASNQQPQINARYNTFLAHAHIAVSTCL